MKTRPSHIMLQSIESDLLYQHQLTDHSPESPYDPDNEVLRLGDGADPWVQEYEGRYYYCKVDSSKQNIVVGSAATLPELADIPMEKVWTHADQQVCTEVWAPEIHFKHGRKVIYYAADDGSNTHYQTYFLEGPAEGLLNYFERHGRLNISGGSFNIDFSIMEINGKNYGIWSGGDGDVVAQQNLYIAEMENLYTLSGDKHCISEPEYEWERSRGGQDFPYVNEGPQGLKHAVAGRKEDVFIVFSANGSWSDEYCLGQLRYLGGDPCRRESWVKREEPVFSKTETIFGPGHASFVHSPDTDEDWIIYHKAKFSGSAWEREVRAQKFTWNPDGSPNFGVPLG